jgi:hypothetical protein
MGRDGNISPAHKRTSLSILQVSIPCQQLCTPDKTFKESAEGATMAQNRTSTKSMHGDKKSFAVTSITIDSS